MVSPECDPDRDRVAGAQVMCNKDVKFAADGRPLEAALAEGLEHPGIVRTVATAVTGAGPGDPSGETWLVMELCNGGDLQARLMMLVQTRSAFAIKLAVLLA